MQEKHKHIIYPLHKILLGFAGVIVLGTLMLLLPGMTRVPLDFVDALFISTSAVCVTGLSTIDVSSVFTLLGKAVILILIQLGGLGIMTFSMGVLSLLGRRMSLRWRDTFSDMYTGSSPIPAGVIIKYILVYTFIIEMVTAVVLFSVFIHQYPFREAAGHSVFHAVSAFCNAGFSTFPDSLLGFQHNPVVIITIAISVILGGLGFFVLYDMVSRSNNTSRVFMGRYSLHTRVVLITSFILTVAGMVLFFILEVNHSMKSMPALDMVLTSFFQSVTCRTAGFNSIDIGGLRESTHFIMIALMFIGGAPGSMAGGIKVTTIAIVFMVIVAKFRGEESVIFQNRYVSQETVNRSLTLVVLSFLFISFVTFLLLTIRDFDLNHSFMSVLFETVSAFGTVGLSTGITPELPIPEKYILVMVMFTGRLGPLTLIAAMVFKQKKIKIKYPEEDILIG